MKKILWLSLSGLMALSLMVAACGPSASQTIPTAPTTPTAPATPIAPTEPTEEKPQQEAVARTEEKPKYGGTITYRLASDPTNFDSGLGSGGALLGTVYQQHTGFDWTRALEAAEKGEVFTRQSLFEDYTGEIVEDWKLLELGVWKLQIRQGVHWQPVDSEAGRLMGGREVTADDVVRNFDRLLNKDGSAPRSWIVIGTAARVAQTATIEKTGPWEVVIRTPEEYMTAWSYLIDGSGFYRFYPPDVVEKYGDMGDWRNAVGTGPFMLIDYVPGSQLLFKRNPLYWEMDPVGLGKGNQLPYADVLRELIIPDLSTAQAAFRTGKLDLLTGVELIDAQSIWTTIPEASYQKYLGSTWILAMRTDKQNKPFSDVRVRQALMLATDFEAIKRDYFGGEAEIDVWPVNRSIPSLHKPLTQMPAAVQELYSYNPDKARQLLKEAGYPNGFKTSIIVQTTAARVDELSVFKSMWAKVGVELELDPKEPGAYAVYGRAGSPFEEMFYRSVGPAYTISLYQGNARGPGIWNPSHINDPSGSLPFMEDLFNQLNANIFVNMPKVHELIRDKQHPFLMEQAFAIPRPSPYEYNFYWPWLKNHYGQGTSWVRYAWIDQDLKKAMGY